MGAAKSFKGSALCPPTVLDFLNMAVKVLVLSSGVGYICALLTTMASALKDPTDAAQHFPTTRHGL